jgi:hypothetical protein
MGYRWAYRVGTRDEYALAEQAERNVIWPGGAGVENAATAFAVQLLPGSLAATVSPRCQRTGRRDASHSGSGP